MKQRKNAAIANAVVYTHTIFIAQLAQFATQLFPALMCSDHTTVLNCEVLCSIGR